MSWGAPQSQNPAYGGGGYGQPPPRPGAPPQGYGPPPAQQQQPYNPAYQPQQQPGYRPPAQGGYQATPQYPGAPQGGYQAPGPNQPGYQGGPGGYQPPPQGGYQPPPQGGYQPPPQGAGQAPGGYPGGFQQTPAPPPGVSQELWQWFQAVDRDRSGKITSVELQQALMNGNWTPFNAETCRLMIGMFDRDRSGTIDVHEFAALWKYVQDWRACFEKFDTDRSGNINSSELSNAFRTFGYNLSQQFCDLCVRVFDRKSTSTINFDDFIQCSVMLKGLTESFKSKDTQQQGVINVHYEEFLKMVLDSPFVK